MTSSIISSIREMYESVVNEIDDECISLSIFINSEGFQYEAKHRTPESLKRIGLSMKNIRGDRIE